MLGGRCACHGRAAACMVALPSQRSCRRHAKMMRNNDLASLSVQRYQEVIDGVVGRVRGEFNQEGIDE